MSTVAGRLAAVGTMSDALTILNRMIDFDASQRAVFGLEPDRHARILGAPGTGKSAVLVEGYARAIDSRGWSETDVLVLAPNRLAAGALRRAIEARVSRALGGTSVRTPSSLAFAVLGQVAAAAGDATPRLLTGTVQDEAIATEVETLIAARGGTEIGPFSDDVLRSPSFRAELREFWRVVDDSDLELAELPELLAGVGERAGVSSVTDLPGSALVDRWIRASGLLRSVAGRLSRERPAELSSSALLRAASRELRAGAVAAPRLILVDDAQELGEGDLGLLAASASAGSRIWAFGDPDLATAAFRGERTRVLSGLAAELERRGAPREEAAEQLVVLSDVHRHGGVIRELVRGMTSRIGTSGAGEQRAAMSRTAGEGAVVFARAASPAEQLGIIAHRLRARKLGLDGEHPVEWADMAIICRSRSEAARISRGLSAHQVPTGIAAGGIVLREYRVVRDLVRLLQYALGIAEISASGVLQLLAGPIGGLDPVTVRRLRGALLLRERRESRLEERETRRTDDVLLEAFRFPGVDPVVDSAGGRALRRLARVAGAGGRTEAAGGTPREVLWAIWEATGLAGRWQSDALDGRGTRADEAHRALDAVLGLFFALQRHEETASEQPVCDLLEELLESAVPEDTLAQRSERDAITVTTPQGVIGREFALVAIAGPEDGAWPNTRSRGQIIGTVEFERWLREGTAMPPSRKDTVHDELRLFAQACSRAREELLVVAIADDDHHPSPFFRFGSDHLREGLPSSRLTLRGVTGEMRRRVVADAADAEAVASLAALAGAGVPGADPDEWYGVRPPSSEEPLYGGAAGASVPVSPSQLERVERCPLDWAVSALGGTTGSVQASLGTLVHHALETAEGADPERLLETIAGEWHKLSFDADWESERMRATAAEMADGLASYLREFEGSDRELLGRESGFSVPIGAAELRGMADRLELRRSGSSAEITVLDLKTGATPITKPEAERNPQLQAYQLGVMRGAFDLEGRAAGAVSGGARLLYVHPEATRGAGFAERVQQPLSEAERVEFEERVVVAASVMAEGSFTARVEHHCSDRHQPGACRLHIIQAVSHS